MTSWGALRRAAVAAPPSPEEPATPVPATVEMVPEVSTLRTLSLPKSATKRLPPESSSSPLGVRSWAEVAGPPSPVSPAAPVPA